MRTDLAVEARENAADRTNIECSEKTDGDVTTVCIDVRNEDDERIIGKPRGRYITVQLPPFTDNAFIPDARYEAISGRLREMLPEEGLVLVAGLGNDEITPDSLGPRTAAKVLATRHITEELRRSAGFDALRPTIVLSAGVLGRTGMESVEFIKAVCAEVCPVAVIAVDALAAGSISRLGCTVQMSDAGISPGAGVGNNRPRIDKDLLGIPVISIGVPTVVDADVIAGGGGAEVAGGMSGMIVTPREIDLLIQRAARLLALSIDHALHPSLDPIELMSV